MFNSSSTDDLAIKKVHWFRSSLTQAAILGLVSFCCPGIWGAMANLGAGGLQSAATGNTANAVLFSLMVVVGILSPALLGKIGSRYSLMIAACGYAPYAAGLYCNTKFGTQWPVILGAAICGLGAGLFWATEGNLIVSYPEAHRRGRAVAIWLSLNQFGSVIGGSLNLGLNANMKNAGGVGTNTYAVFIALQCLGPLFAALLSNADQVQRTDGRTPTVVSNKDGFVAEVKATLRVWTKPRNLLYSIAFFMTQWGSGSTGAYLANYMTVRSRALSSLVVALLNQSLIWALGTFLDNKRFSFRIRAGTVGFLLTAGLGYSWIHFFVNQYHFFHMAAAPVFDWSSPGFGNAWVPIVLNSVSSQLLYNWLYWVVAAHAVGEEMGRQVSCMRVVESLSSTITYGVSAGKLPVINVAATNLAIYGIAVYPIFHAVCYAIQREEQGLNNLPPVEYLDEQAPGDAKAAEVDTPDVKDNSDKQLA